MVDDIPNLAAQTYFYQKDTIAWLGADENFPKQRKWVATLQSLSSLL